MKIKVVIIHHQNDRRQFTFRVPESVDIEAGDIVLCDTGIGKGLVSWQAGNCSISGTALWT